MRRKRLTGLVIPWQRRLSAFQTGGRKFRFGEPLAAHGFDRKTPQPRDRTDDFVGCHVVLCVVMDVGGLLQFFQ
jgi:hypothetical protein